MVALFSRWSEEEGFIVGTMIASLVALVVSGAFFVPLVGSLGWLLAIALQPILASQLIPRCPASWPLTLSLALFFGLPFLLPLSYYW